MQIQYSDLLPIAALLIPVFVYALAYWIFKRIELIEDQKEQAALQAWLQDHDQNKNKVVAEDETYKLMYSPAANAYAAGCRFFTPKQALKHWTKVSKLKPISDDPRRLEYLIDRINRAKLFTQAIKQHQLSLKEKS